VAGRPVQLQGLPGVAERLAVAALQFTRRGEKEVGGALADVVAELLVQLQGAVQVGVGVGVGTQPSAEDAESTVGKGLLSQIAEALRRGQRGGLCGEAVVPFPPPVKEGYQRPEQLAGVEVEAVRGRLRDGREDDRVFCLQPSPCLLVVGQLLGGGARSRGG
jgi:hypothetical protein